jgi:hypothetical protein
MRWHPAHDQALADSVGSSIRPLRQSVAYSHAPGAAFANFALVTAMLKGAYCHNIVKGMAQRATCFGAEEMTRRAL